MRTKKSAIELISQARKLGAEITMGPDATIHVKCRQRLPDAMHHELHVRSVEVARCIVITATVELAKELAMDGGELKLLEDIEHAIACGEGAAAFEVEYAEGKEGEA